jgi:phosphoenolpyruvate phosphomutase
VISKAKKLRGLLGTERLIRAVGAHDGISARLVEAAGFEAIWASSLGLSASYAIPDAGVLTMTQSLDAAERIDAATSLPVIADCDTGYGGPRNVEEMVRWYERRRIAAVCIEDKVHPKTNSYADVAHPLVNIGEFVEKIRAGKDAQESSDFMLLARTEAFIAALPLHAALERALAYADAGADAILVHSRIDSPDEILAFAEAWTMSVPLVAVPTTYNGIHERDLSEAGIRIVIYANQLIRAQTMAARTMLDTLRTSGTASAVEKEIVRIGDLFALQDMGTTTWAPQ